MRRPGRRVARAASSRASISVKPTRTTAWPYDSYVMSLAWFCRVGGNHDRHWYYDCKVANVQMGGTLRTETDTRLQASHNAGLLCAQAALAGTARQIVDQGGDCALASKGNQGDHARYVNYGTDSLRGSHAVIGADVTGSGIFQASQNKSAAPDLNLRG
jgi:hypothetical protein